MDYSFSRRRGAGASGVLILAAMALWGTNQTRAEDWVQWRGNDRTGAWTETGILEKFPEGGLEVTWRKEIGAGYSGPVVSRGRIVTMDYREKPGTRIMEALERVICLDEKTGEPIWADEWETHYREIMQSYQTGPRATPSIDGDRVYAMGAAGHVRCLDFKTGELLWAKDARKDYNTSIPIWGMAGSPLVDGEKVIFITGGDSGDQVKAFNKMTGEEIWSALPTDYEMGYCSPIIYEAGGARQMIVWDPKAVHSLNPETGEVYWSIPMEIKGSMSIAMPVKHGSKLLVSSFYSGSMLMELDPGKPMAKKLWHVKGKSELPGKSVGLNSVMTTPVVIGDYIYSTCSYGEFRCVKLEDSSRVWVRDDLTRQGRWGSAFIVKNGDRYFMNNDEGELLILRFTPEGPEVIDRTKLIEPNTNSGFGPRRLFASTVNWVQPAYANRHIVIRNDGEILRASLAK